MLMVRIYLFVMLVILLVGYSIFLFLFLFRIVRVFIRVSGVFWVIIGVEGVGFYS